MKKRGFYLEENRPNYRYKLHCINDLQEIITVLKHKLESYH
jgi:hypothetical protein